MSMVRNRPLAVAWLCIALFAFGCTETETDAPPGNPNRLPDAKLAPTLLDDADELAAYLAAFPLDQYEVATVEGVGSFYIDDNPAWVKREIKAGRAWEPATKQAMADLVEPGTTALDIGAHIGSHTVTLAQLLGPDGVVYAFEPQRKIYRELVKNLELNEVTNAVPLRFAVGNQNKLIEMSPTNDFDGRMHVGRGGDAAELRRIDDFGFQNVSLMKVDVEGFELEVLKGARETIARWHPAIIIEITGFFQYRQLDANGRALIDGIVGFFKQQGYRLDFIEHAGEPHFIARYVATAPPGNPAGGRTAPPGPRPPQNE